MTRAAQDKIDYALQKEALVYDGYLIHQRYMTKVEPIFKNNPKADWLAPLNKAGWHFPSDPLKLRYYFFIYQRMFRWSGWSQLESRDFSISALIYLACYRERISSLYRHPEEGFREMPYAKPEKLAAKTRQLFLLPYAEDRGFDSNLTADDLAVLFRPDNGRTGYIPPEIEHRPEVVLSLAFDANAIISRAFVSPRKSPEIEKISESQARAIAPSFESFNKTAEVSEEDAINGVFLQILEHRLIKHPERANFETGDHARLCLLYLHLYRWPLPAGFRREPFATTWDKLPREDKEWTAARFRRKLSERREAWYKQKA